MRELNFAELAQHAYSRTVLRELSLPDSAVSHGAKYRDAIQAVAEFASRQTRRITLGQSYDITFREIAKTHKYEHYYKTELISKLIFGRHSPRTSSALVELSTGTAIADMVVYNGTSTAYEIKTEYDNFDRVLSQVESYRSIAELVNVVTPERSASLALKKLPGWVGVVCLSKRGTLSLVRYPSSQMDSLSIPRLVEMLRASERRDVTRHVLGAEHSGGSRAGVDEIVSTLNKVDRPTAHKALVRAFRVRGQSLGVLATNTGFPRSLRVAAYAQPLSKSAQARVLEKLNTRIEVFA